MFKRVLFLGLVALTAVAQEIPRAQGLYAHLETDAGTIVLLLEFEKAPVTVANFVGLAEGTLANGVVEMGTPFFDGSVFHRVVPGHVIQAGPPERPGTGKLGYLLPNEIETSLNHGKAGMLGMANTGPHTATYQFYITLGDRSYLDGDYVVFGHVVRGLDVVLKIKKDDRIGKITIERVGAKAEGFRPDSDSFHQARMRLQQRNQTLMRDRRKQENEYLSKQFPASQTTASGLRYQVLENGDGSVVKQGDTLLVRYRGQRLGGAAFASNQNGQPVEGEARSFLVDLETRSLNKGLDEMLKAMSRGEKRVVVVTPEMAYDPVGYYGQPLPGQKRFVIRPYTTLVYELELLEIKP